MGQDRLLLAIRDHAIILIVPPQPQYSISLEAPQILNVCDQQKIVPERLALILGKRHVIVVHVALHFSRPVLDAETCVLVRAARAIKALVEIGDADLLADIARLVSNPKFLGPGVDYYFVAVQIRANVDVSIVVDIQDIDK